MALVAAAPRLWWLTLVIGSALLVGYFLLPDVAWQDVAYDGWTSIVALLVLLGIRINRPPRPMPWLVLAAGLGLTAAGDWTWTLLAAMGEEPFPSVADLFYLSGMAMIAAAVWMDGRGRVPGGDRAAVLDSLILAAGFAMLVWLLVMRPIAVADSASVIETTVALAYPTIDIALLAVTARLLLGSGARAPSYRLLAVALGAYLAADMWFAWLDLEGAYATGHLVDAGWLMGTLCFAAAALHPSMRLSSQALPGDMGRLTMRRVCLLTAASLMPPLLLLLQAWQGVEIDAIVIAAGSIALFLLVIGRLLTVLVDLRRVLAERQELEAALRRQASEDPLTGLANRGHFGTRLAAALARPGESIGIVFVDLDDFKAINDRLGHDAGDQLLRQVGERLRAVVRASDTPARLGGDEFAVLLADGADHEVALTVAARVLEELARPVDLGPYGVVRVTASAGVGLGIAGSVDAESMLRVADLAMYRSKGAGKGRLSVAEPSDDTPALPGGILHASRFATG